MNFGLKQRGCFEKRQVKLYSAFHNRLCLVLFAILIAKEHLMSASDSVSRRIRFILEGLEVGLVLDCETDFKNLSLADKL